MVVRFSDEGIPVKDNVQWHEFLKLESPHPYGVRPQGNRLLDEEDDADLKRNVNPNEAFFLQLRDETWLNILGFCDGVSLARVVQTCRFFYVAGHQPELWRDLCLRKLNSKTSNGSSNFSLENVGDSWKDSFVLLENNGELKGPAHQPMMIPGIYSDDLYRLHSCRAFALPPSWFRETPTNKNSQLFTSKGLVPCVKADDLTCEEFVTNYEAKNLPVVIKGAASTWKAYKNWQDPDYLRQHTSGRTFRATSGNAPLPANFALDAFQKYCSRPILEEAPLYLFDREALIPGSPLHQDYYPDLQRTCPYFDPSRTTSANCEEEDIVGHDLFQVLGEGKRPDHTWAIIGGNHSGSVFHIDPNATHAWNAAIAGRKRWIFYPPGVTPPGIHPSDDGDEVALPLSIGEWILTFWREHQDRKKASKNLPLSQRPLECTAHPGDVVFVPHGWWHMVINLDHTNIAITHNYVSKSNVGNLLRFLSQKEDQISGCRDRKESIKPEHLHTAFLEALQGQFGHDADWLVQAQKQAESHWTCGAWKDDDSYTSNAHRLATSKKRRLEVSKLGPDKKREVEARASCTTSVMEKAKEVGSDNPSCAPFSFSFL